MDDLFLFARGEVHSCRILLKGLEEFKNGSGLTPSVAKSTVFFCQVPQRVKRAILAIMPFDEGKLPVKYLGVPLISTNLVASNYKILIEKVDRRIDDWKNKSLSFAGRLQLIVSVISSMYVYWASVLVLPSSTVKELEQKMKGFLWQKNSNERAKSKVAWSDVCLPKTEGGLGIRNISDVNRSLISYHLWSIIIHRKSLWVDWIYDHKLKGRSIWDVTPKAKMTWSWRKILQIRVLIRPHIRQKIGNGRDTFAWSDNWCNQSPLNRFITPRDIYNAGFSLHAKVADLVSNMNWKWHVAWYELFPVLIHVHVPVISTNRKDVTILHDMHGEERTFSTMMVWDTIRQRKQLINWYNVVWFTHCIPRHAFHAWSGRLFGFFTDMVQVDGKWEDIVQKEMQDCLRMTSGLRPRFRCYIEDWTESDTISFDLESLDFKKLSRADSVAMIRRVTDEERNTGVGSGFKYHNLCASQRVGGEVKSCMILMKGLEEFRLTSGLAASIDKSTVFFCQVNQALKRAIMDVMPFEEGKLPVRYLGVPLISSNLIAANCKALIEKVDRRIDDWMNKALSFAGRLQLIVSVISSMFTYWASVLMLPASTVKELERKMKGFLWQKDEKDRAKSKERCKYMAG
ncbi:hypothetical protein QVD17_24468 [Tagetes erecta]|uniref:Reverse transcriptase domain-containing protein n=1 Tax=Tagetes erecta TaxID=13708 RepID=A0AAD8NUL4_TARER|nr:hypothetical protein QVD17_24468 [Tagetes erecta]